MANPNQALPFDTNESSMELNIGLTGEPVLQALTTDLPTKTTRPLQRRDLSKTQPSLSGGQSWIQSRVLDPSKPEYMPQTPQKLTSQIVEKEKINKLLMDENENLTKFLAQSKSTNITVPIQTQKSSSTIVDLKVGR